MQGDPAELYENPDPSDLAKLSLPFNIYEVEPQCLKCIRRQLAKYNNSVDINKKSLENRFIVQCTGVPRMPTNPGLKYLLSLEEYEEAERIMNPVKWAKHYLSNPDYTPWEARFYQEEVMRCTSLRRALRISRRTGKTDMVSVEIVWKMFIRGDRRIVVAAPQKVHVEEIFNRVRGFIYRNPVLADSVVKDVSSPVYKLELNNKSYVMGFALGTRGKTEGLSVRGQNADDIYCDEMDYVDEKAIQGGLLPILQTTDSTTMTGFSTPTGFKSVYYSFCEEMPEFREFHFNYKVLPHWKKVEADRGAYTEEEWIHEMLAEWGSSEEGVYKPSYVDRSMKSYLYEEMTGPMPGWRYIVGVDWNEKHGAEICIVGENTLNGYYQLVDAFCVEKTDYTQIASISAVIEVNRKWKPVFIFVDAGNGSTNYEMLRKLSWDQRRKNGDRDTARIIDILRKYDSGASLQTKDPITGEPRKAPAKPYMVNASVRAFENDRIRISSADKELEKQLRNYIIERISPTGNPVYGMRDKKVKDHRLDALNLAMVGFYLEFGGLQPQVAITSMVATVNPITKKIGTPRAQKPEPVSADRGIELPESKSALNRHYGSVMPARISQVYEMSNTNPGWATDEEAKYEQMYAHRRLKRGSNKRSRPASRSNI
jgi:replicative DNA helicase